MTDRLAAVALRILATRALAFGEGDEDALQNVDTTELPDGALAFVTREKSYYTLDRDLSLISVNAADPALITPANGPGQWLIVAGTGMLSFSYQISMNNGPQTITSATTFTNMPNTTTWTNEDVLDTTGGLTNTAFWSAASPGAGVLTYHGPPRYFQVYGSISYNNAEAGDNPQQAELYLSKNGSLINQAGNPAPVRGAWNSEPLAPGEVPIEIVAMSRMLMQSGDTVQLAFFDRFLTGDDTAIARANLAVFPIG